MTIRHAAALALVGWYLMTPPLAPGSTANAPEADESAPLWQWNQLNAFDTAKECEDYKVRFHEDLEKKNKKRAEYELSAACVESTDVRLKRN